MCVCCVYCHSVYCHRVEKLGNGCISEYFLKMYITEWIEIR